MLVDTSTPGTTPVWWTFRAPDGTVARTMGRLYVEAREAAAILLGVSPQDLRPVDGKGP